MIYVGVMPTSSLPSASRIAHIEFKEEKMTAGKMVKYWYVWVIDPDRIPPAFPEDTLQKEKVRKLDKIFNRLKNKFLTLAVALAVTLAATPSGAQIIFTPGDLPWIDESGMYVYPAEVISVYDGDTFTAKVDLGFSVSVVHTFRLANVDTPEVRGAERPEGVRVRDYVRGLIEGKEVFLMTYDDRTGKYGRYLSDVWTLIELEKSVFWINLGPHLLENGMADKYE